MDINIRLPFRLARRFSTATTSSSESHDLREQDNKETTSLEIPHPMIRKRKRSLTLPLVEPATVGRLRKRYQETYDQLQSPLFSVLPAEIRLLIWEFVLGGFDIHIFDWARKLGHLICRPDEQPPERVRQVCIGPIDCGNSEGALHRGPYSFLSLPMTCRRAYTESIDLIYSRNTFHFLNYRYRMSKLAARVLPHRWASIRSIYITYFQPVLSHYEDGFFISRWASQCTLLAAMPNLHRLIIALACPRNQYAYEAEPAVLLRRALLPFLQELRKVRVRGPTAMSGGICTSNGGVGSDGCGGGRRVFDVYVPYTEEAGGEGDGSGDGGGGGGGEVRMGDGVLNEAFFAEESLQGSLPFRIVRMPSHVLRFHENQSNEIPIEQAVRAFGY